MATNDISDAVTTNYVPMSGQHLSGNSQRSKGGYITLVALLAALSFSSCIPDKESNQANAQQQLISKRVAADRAVEATNEYDLQQKKEKESVDPTNKQPEKELTEPSNKPKEPIKKTEPGKLPTPPKKSSEKKPADTQPQEKKEPTSLRRWFEQKQADAFYTYTRGNYAALGLRGGRFKHGRDGGVSEGKSIEGVELEGIVGFELKESPTLLRVLTLGSDSISAKGAVLSGPDGSTGRIRLMSAYLLGNYVVLEPIVQSSGESGSTAKYKEPNDRSVGGRILFKLSDNTASYFKYLATHGGYHLLHKKSGGRHSKDTEVGVQFRFSDDATLEAGIRNTNTKYNGLEDENDDGILGADIILAKEFGKWLLSVGGAYDRSTLRADDRRIARSVKVDSFTGKLGIGYQISPELAVISDAYIGHESGGSIGFVIPLGKTDKK